MVPTTTTTTTPHIPGHHRRISALKNTTINFFKGYNKVSSPSSQLGPRSELTISTPIRFINEDLLSPHSQDLASPTRAGVKPSFDNKTCNSHPPIAITNSSYSKPVSSFTGPSSSISKDTLGQSSSLAGAEIIEETPIAPPMNDNGRAKSPSHSRSSGDNETPAVNEKVGSSNLSGAGKKHAKFRMALSILRRRSNPNLPRGDTHVESAEEENTGEKGLATFNEPLLDPDFAMSEEFSPQLSPLSLPLPTRRKSARAATSAKSNGFKFSLPALSSRSVLNRSRQSATDPPNRYDTALSNVIENQSTANNIWPGGVDAHTSQFTSPGESAPDEPSNESIFSRESTVFNSPSGLFPRPASMQRHWHDCPPPRNMPTNSIDMSSTVNATPNLNRQTRGLDRIRPLSFGGVPSHVGPGSMKITEAAALESRINELEVQVVSLRKIIVESGTFQQHGLGVQSPPSFEGAVLSRLDDDMAGNTAVDDEEDPVFTAMLQEVNPRCSVSRRELSWDQTLKALEGSNINSEFKRNTISTIRGPACEGSRQSTRSANSPKPATLPEYTGVVSMLRREHQARKKLENQVVALQEQMAAVLHRQLISQSNRSPTIAHKQSQLHLKSVEFNRLHRQPSSEEIPTPEITPPSSSSAADGTNNVFTNFDSGDTSEDDNDADEGDNGHNVYISSPIESEIWATPTEESIPVTHNNLPHLHRMDSDSTFGEALVFPSAPASRTMSLGQVTQKVLGRS